MNSISAVEIEGKTFATRMRGYDPQQVRQFLGSVANDMEALVRENRELRSQVHILEADVERHKRMEESIQKTLMLAQQSSEELRVAARQEAAAIVREAEASKASLENDVKRLHSERSAFIAQLKSYIDAFYGRLEEPAQAKAVVGG